MKWNLAKPNSCSLWTDRWAPFHPLFSPSNTPVSFPTLSLAVGSCLWFKGEQILTEQMETWICSEWTWNFSWHKSETCQHLEKDIHEWKRRHHGKCFIFSEDFSLQYEMWYFFTQFPYMHSPFPRNPKEKQLRLQEAYCGPLNNYSIRSLTRAVWWGWGEGMNAESKHSHTCKKFSATNSTNH